MKHTGTKGGEDMAQNGRGMSELPDAREWLIYSPQEMDTAKSLWLVKNTHELGVTENTVTVQSDFSEKNLANCREFFRAFPSVFVAYKDTATANGIVEMIQDYIPDITVLTPKDGVFGRFNSLQEMREASGQRAVDHVLIGAVEHPPKGLLNLADVQFQHAPRFSSGIRFLDEKIGGFYLGELSVWTGKRGGGKSTILGQTFLEAVEQGIPVCAYSGELSASQFKSWLMQQAAGPQNVTPFVNPESGKTEYTITEGARKKIDEWWNKMFFLYDNSIPGASDEDSIMQTFQYADRKYGCVMYLVDNLMSIRFRGAEKSMQNFYQAQSSFTGRLVEFAKKYCVHVHLVAHPRKTNRQNGKIEDADDVSGTGDITNRADNVFSMERLNDEEAQREGCNSILRILKNRGFGESGFVKLDYDQRSRRFFKTGSTLGPNKQYGWDKD